MIRRSSPPLVPSSLRSRPMSPLAGVWRRLPTATSLIIGILVGLLFANVSKLERLYVCARWVSLIEARADLVSGSFVASSSSHHET